MRFLRKAIEGEEYMEAIDLKKFERTLMKRVNEYLGTLPGNRFANYKYYVKSIFMALAMWGPYFTLILVDAPTWLFWALWALMGIATAGIGMNVMHDAIHDSVSPNKNINRFFGASIYFLCGNALNWRIQHNHLHHNYTNEFGMDDDIDTGGLIRLHPEDEKKSIHKYQHIYAPFLYGLLTLNWVLLKEIKQLKRYRKSGLTQRFGKAFWMEIAIFTITKLIYFALFLVLPISMGYSVGMVIGGFLVMHFTAGVILSFVFQLAHIISDVDTAKNSDVRAVHQLATTANFATRSKFLTWCLGGLNYQVEHHLFPGVSHIHYPKINKIVKETTEEFKVAYYEKKTFFEAVFNHLRYLKNLGVAA